MNCLKYSFLLILIALQACVSKEETKENTSLINCNVTHVDWAKNSIIYEVNIRQYTSEGTFAAFTKELPRLKDLGVDILWIMPIHPIGEINRKGSLGSYYSVKDYKAVNPNYGTIADFKAMVDSAHTQGMHVIIDWVANHSSWDNPWVNDHPDWYAKDSTGKMFGPYNWTDVAQLNYEVPELHDGMIDAMKFWVSETSIDGFRCDVAGMVPLAFWEKARKALDEIKPVFMLAEDEGTPALLENAFDMNYSWSMHHLMNEIAKGKASASALTNYFSKEDSIFAKNCYRMQFITNHDENSWNGTEFERMGDGVKAFAVMSFTIPGMPLIYTGQEVGMNSRLEFFEKETVTYSENEYPAFYKSLTSLKKNNEVFWNGSAGGDLLILDTQNDSVFAFKRYTSQSEAFVVLNLSKNPQEYTVPKGMAGAYNDYFASESDVKNEGEKGTLNAWEYKVYLEN